MGRPGGGGGHTGGGHSAGGGFSGGGRPGGGYSGGGRPGGPGGPGGRPGGPGGPPPPRPGFWGGFGYGGYGGYRRGCGTGCLTPIIVIIVVIVILISSAVSSLGGGIRYALSRLRGNSQEVTEETEYNQDNESTQNTSTREKITANTAFNSDCIIDELGWVEDANATGESLESFYDATGVQPYVYFRAYDSSLTTNTEKEEFAYEWYDENIDNQGTFLYIYFAEEDSDNDMGYMVYVNGNDVDSVMDEEAVEIFWDYVDEYWYSSLSTDDMLTAIFDSTANAIMN